MNWLTVIQLITKQVNIVLVLIIVLHLISTSVVQAAGTINVTTTADEYNAIGAGTGCSLREAIQSANTDSDFGGCTRSGTPPYTIQISANTYSISLNLNNGTENNNQEDDFDIQTSLNISGVNAIQTVIDGNRLDRVFHINPNSVRGIAVIISDVTIQNGKSQQGGGGIHNRGASLTLSNVVIRNNEGGSDEAGGVGGIYNEANAGLGAKVILNNVTLSDNVSNLRGGGILNHAITANAEMALTNVTVSGNRAAWQGGGIVTDANSSYISKVTLNNSTVTNNTSNLSGGGVSRIGNSGSRIEIKNSIVAGNKIGESVTASKADCDGTVVSLDYNLVGDSTGCPSNGIGDQTVSPSKIFSDVLGSLQDNGGTTPTHVLLIGSPAVNAGNPSGCTNDANFPLATDQRGVIRPQGIYCDIGAFEAQAIPLLNKTVDNITPIQGQLITYTLTISNNGALTATNVLISDTLPPDTTFAGPLRLLPSNTILPSPTSSILVDDVTIVPGQQISLTFPVTVNVEVVEGTVIANTASLTSTEVVIPITDMVKITVVPASNSPAPIAYLPVILKY